MSRIREGGGKIAAKRRMNFDKDSGEKVE